MSTFRFKQFQIVQEKSAHKVGTDGTLLGAWVNIDAVSRILDIGTGTGLIALMLAQRTSEFTTIDAIELEADDALEASTNVMNSPWNEKIAVHATALQSFHPEGNYDLIVTNPPFFINSWLPSEKRRAEARHTHSLAFTDILNFSERYLSPEGRLSLVLPYAEASQFIAAAHIRGYRELRKCDVRSRSNKPVERVLLEFSRKQSTPSTETLIIHAAGNEWSDAYKTLTREFYLKI